MKPKKKRVYRVWVWDRNYNGWVPESDWSTPSEALVIKESLSMGNFCKVMEFMK